MKVGVQQDWTCRWRRKNTGSILKQYLFLFTTVEYTFPYTQPTITRECKCLKISKVLSIKLSPWSSLRTNFGSVLSASETYCLNYQLSCDVKSKNFAFKWPLINATEDFRFVFLNANLMPTRSGNHDLTYVCAGVCVRCSSLNRRTLLVWTNWHRTGLEKKIFAKSESEYTVLSV